MDDVAQRLRAVVSGRVQGVGFRDFVQRRAQAIGVHGTVRNRPDGAVEVVAEGDRAQLESLLADLQAGPRMAAVDGVQAEWREAEGDLRGFRVTY